MTDEDIVAALAEVLYEKPVHYDRASLRVQAAALLPLVRRVAEQRAAEAYEQGQEDIRQTLDLLRARAAALTATPNHGTDAT